MISENDKETKRRLSQYLNKIVLFALCTTSSNSLLTHPNQQDKADSSRRRL